MISNIIKVWYFRKECKLSFSITWSLRVQAFHLLGPGSIPGKIKDFNLKSETGHVSIVLSLGKALTFWWPEISLWNIFKEACPYFLSRILVHNNHSRNHHHHQSVLPRAGLSLQTGTKAAVPPKGKSSTANSRTKFAVLPEMLSAPHSLFSIWTDLKRSQGHQRGWEWIWLTGPSRLNRNSPQGLKISSIKVFE